MNLGIGLPTLVARYLPDDVHVFFQSENGLIGMQPLPEEGFAWIGVTDAGGNPAGAVPGACAFDSALSFGIIRGGHLDVTVLGDWRWTSRVTWQTGWCLGKWCPGWEVPWIW